VKILSVFSNTDGHGRKFSFRFFILSEYFIIISVMFSLFFYIYVLVLFVMITELTIKQLPCKLMDSNYSFETRPGRSTWDLADPGLESGRVEEKIEERKIRRDPATRSKTRLRSVDFCFFTKTTSFLFKKKKLTRATRWSGTRTLYRTGSEKYDSNTNYFGF
jgi:hypothetical protein